MATISEAPMTLGIAITVKAKIKKNSNSVFSKDKSELPEVAFSLPGCDIFQETLPSILSWEMNGSSQAP